MSRQKPTRRDLLLVIGHLQGMIGQALQYHGNDRNSNGFEEGQKKLKKAHALCVEATSFDPPIPFTGSRRGWNDVITR